MRSLALTENFVDPAQVAMALPLKPIENLFIDSDRDLDFEGAIVLADHRVAPMIGR